MIYSKASEVKYFDKQGNQGLRKIIKIPRRLSLKIIVALVLPEMKEYNTRAMQSPYRRDSEAGDTENNNLQ